VGAGDVVIVAAACSVFAPAASRFLVFAARVLAVQPFFGVAFAHVMHRLFLVLMSHFQISFAVNSNWLSGEQKICHKRNEKSMPDFSFLISAFYRLNIAR
jgi:hypothetical protein